MKLTVLHYPDPRLRLTARPVKEVRDSTRRLADDMLETMYDERGIGLAATQVGITKRLLVMDVSEDKSEPRVLINPVILNKSGVVESNEGCLSVPGFYEPVRRASRIEIEYLDRDGTHVRTEWEGLQAVCAQHEIDHLNGKLFVDYLSALKRSRIRKRIDKQRRDIA
ncbi:MAG: peptide deformylase [Gammaproteobacteria bacterium]|nr:peptide deformylase [Gammaproteobacteria bacterium]